MPAVHLQVLDVDGAFGDSAGVSAAPKEGWYEDPARRHEYRWFSQGKPTDLVRNGADASNDPLSMTDRELFSVMELAGPPDEGSVMQSHAAPSTFGLLGDGIGPAYLGSTAVPTGRAGVAYDASRRWRTSAGITETLLIAVPVFVALYFLAAGRPLVYSVGCIVLSILLWIAGWTRRSRRAHRWAEAAPKRRR